MAVALIIVIHSLSSPILGFHFKCHWPPWIKPQQDLGYASDHLLKVIGFVISYGVSLIFVVNSSSTTNSKVWLDLVILLISWLSRLDITVNEGFDEIENEVNQMVLVSDFGKIYRFTILRDLHSISQLCVGGRYVEELIRIFVHFFYLGG